MDIIDIVNDNMTDMEIEMMLLAKSQMLPEKNKDGEYVHKFVRTCKDPNLSVKANIVEFLNAGLLTKEGNTYFNGDEGLGSLKETIAKLKEKTYSGELLKLQSRLEEAKNKNK